jgi:hypothetical protein
VKAFSLMLKGNSGKMKPCHGKLVVARHADFAASSTAEKLKAMSVFAVDRLGSPYDPGDIVQILFRIVGGWLGRKLPPSKRMSNTSARNTPPRVIARSGSALLHPNLDLSRRATSL